MINNANVGLPTSSIMTGLLTQRRKSEFNKMSSQLFLKETEEGKYYRLRLLNTTPNQKFVTSSNFQHYRDFPFIIQHVHTVWSDIPTDDPNKTKRICKTIVCPQTDYVKANSTLSKAQCPMCAAYGSAWKAYKDSGYKNIEAKNKMKNLHNTQVVRVLVYVVQDPNYESNNGAVKVLSLDEDAYQALLTQINASAKNNTPIWNNDSCDLFFTWGKFDKTVNEGKEITEEVVVSCVKKFAKQLEDSLESAKLANRPDMIKKIEDELADVSMFLPAMIPDNMIEGIVKEIVAKKEAELGRPLGKKDFGLVMKSTPANCDKKVCSKLLQGILT